MSDLQFTPATDLDPEFTVTTATQHSALAGRSTAGAHPATAVTYDNTTSGLAADTVQEALDEIAAGGGGAVDSVNGETGTVVLDAADVDAVPITAVGLLAGETNRGDWSGATAYVPGDVVHDHAALGLYVCTVANTNEQPSLTPAKWTEIDGTGRELALGMGSSSTGAFAASVGTGAESGGMLATAIGSSASAADVGSTAVGLAASAAGATATAIGATASAAGVASTAIGTGASAPLDGDVNIANILTGHIDTGTYLSDEAPVLPFGALDLPETADTSNPAAGSQRLVARTDGLYVRDEAGAEVGPLGSGGTETLPATIIDAAGDLIVGTAADTAARLAVGTSGQVLTSNGTTAAWAAPTHNPPMIARVAGTWYGAVGNCAASTAHNVNASGVMQVMPVRLTAGTYDRIAVTTSVAAVSTWRLGVYNCDTNGDPRGQARLIDSGTVDMNATAGVLAITGTITIPTTGVYGLAILCDAYTATPTVFRHDNSIGDRLAVIPAVHADLSDTAGRGARFALRFTAVSTGSIPTTCPTGGSWIDSSPRVILRGS